MNEKIRNGLRLGQCLRKDQYQLLIDLRETLPRLDRPPAVRPSRMHTKTITPIEKEAWMSQTDHAKPSPYTVAVVQDMLRLSESLLAELQGNAREALELWLVAKTRQSSKQES